MDVNGDGFFHQDVEPGVEGFDADGGVGEVGRADEDGVDATGADHQLHVGEGAFAFEELWQRAEAFAQGGDAEAGHFAGANVVQVGLAHVAEADDAKSNFIHMPTRLGGRALVVKRFDRGGSGGDNETIRQ